jgi:hypothetical protein
MDQIKSFMQRAYTSPRNRPSRWQWTTPFLAILIVAVSIAYWRDVNIETEHAKTQQIDYEDTALCTKFGFAADTDKHAACKLDLLDLRHSHEELLSATSLL